MLINHHLLPRHRALADLQEKSSLTWSFQVWASYEQHKIPALCSVAAELDPLVSFPQPRRKRKKKKQRELSLLFLPLPLLHHHHNHRDPHPQAKEAWIEGWTRNRKMIFWTTWMQSEPFFSCWKDSLASATPSKNSLEIDLRTISIFHQND